MNYFELERAIYLTIAVAALLSIIVAGIIKIVIFIGERRERHAGRHKQVSDTNAGSRNLRG